MESGANTKEVLTPKNVYRFLTDNLPGLYPHGVIPAAERKGLTLVKFWAQVLDGIIPPEWHASLFGGTQRSRRLSDMMNRTGVQPLPPKLQQEMNALLRMTISYHDYREDFYHAFLAGIFTGAGYMVDSNKEHGEGRSDVVVYDPVNGRVAIFEAKYTKNQEKLESTCNTALQQIDERLYAKEYEDDYDQILCYGISFFKKRCLVKKK